MVFRLPYPVRAFLLKKYMKKNISLIKLTIRRTTLIPFIPKPEALIPRLAIQKLSLTPISNSIHYKVDSFIVESVLLTFTLSSICYHIMMSKEKDDDLVDKCTDDLQPDDDITNILKDNEFFDYLLQSLNDHYGKLSGLEKVTLRRPAEFTKEFFANYWLLLMKKAGIDIVPTVNVKDNDDNKEEKNGHNGFDSIHRSIFEVCESDIDLRLTTIFSFKGSLLADEEEIEIRNKFMLALLFVSFWVADKKEDCPNVILKESMAQLVHICFNKLFKDIYRGNDKNFKNFIFDENKEMSCSSPDIFPFSPNHSLNTSDLSCINDITIIDQKSAQNEIEIVRLSGTYEALVKIVASQKDNEEKLVNDNKHLQEIFKEKIVEMESVKQVNAEFLMENENLKQALLKTKNELNQKEAENKNILEQHRSLNDELQAKNEKFKIQLSNATNENYRLQEKNNELTNTVSSHKRNEERIQKELDAKIMESENNNNILVEQRKRLEEVFLKVKQELMESRNLVAEKDAENKNILGQIQSLNDTVGKLEANLDSCKGEMSKLGSENVQLKDTVTALKEEKKALQQHFEDKQHEFDAANKEHADVAEEKRFVQQSLIKTRNALIESNNIIIEKEAKMKIILEEKQLLNGTINKLQMDFDLCRDELANNIDKCDGLKEENEELKKALNRKTRNEEKLEAEKQALQKALNAISMELNEAKQILIRIQAEFRHVLQQLRSFCLINAEIREELDAFKIFFDNVIINNGITLENLQSQFNDFVAERLHNISLTNQLELLQDELCSRERSQTPSIHDEGFRTSHNNGNGLFDGEMLSELMSEPFNDEENDNVNDEIKQTQKPISRDVATLTHREMSVPQKTSSALNFLFFFLSILIFFTMWISFFGVLIPSWVHIQVHHDHLPPQ
uniref:Uncharacterized protein n=1 Tax=Panagrolaimus sp. ES5 TaxID=591445 RepID=A0AC34FJM5_9BILA